MPTVELPAAAQTLVRLAEAETVMTPVMAPARATFLSSAAETVAVAKTDESMSRVSPTSPLKVAKLRTDPLNSTRYPDYANVIDRDAAGKVTVSAWLTVLAMVRAPKNSRLPPEAAS